MLRLLNWKVAWKAEQGAPLDPADASAVKVFGTEFYMESLRRLLDLERPLLADAAPAEPPGAGESGVDTASLIEELDALLSEADSHALTLWAQHESDFIGMLPARRAKALAGAMQRFDFDEAQAALRGETKEP